MTAALNDMQKYLSKRHGVSSHTSGNLRHHYVCLFLYLVEQVEFSQLLSDVDLLYFHRGQSQQRELHALLFSDSVWREMQTTNVMKCFIPRRDKSRYPKPNLKTKKKTNIEKLSLYHVKNKWCDLRLDLSRPTP